MNDERQYKRKTLSIRQSTVDLLDRFCKDHKISRTGLLEELATALLLEETRYFKIESLDNTDLSLLHPSADNRWNVIKHKVRLLSVEFGIQLPTETSKDFYDACQQVGVTRKQADKVLHLVLLEVVDGNFDDEEGG